MSEAVAPAPAPAAPAAESPPAASTEIVGSTPTNEPTKAEIRKLKLSLDSGDIELPESDILEMAKAAAKGYQSEQSSTAKLRAIEEAFKADPAEFFKQFGMDFDDFAIKKLEQRYNDELEDSKLSPEAKELKLLKREMAKRAAEAKQEQERAKAEQGQREVAEATVKLRATIKEALGSTTLPHTPVTERRMAQLMYRNAELGLDIPPSAIAKLVESEVAAEHTSLFDSLDGDKLLDRIGEKRFEKALKAYAARKKIAPKTPKVEETPPEMPKGKDGKPAKFITESEFKRMQKTKLTDMYKRDI